MAEASRWALPWAAAVVVALLAARASAFSAAASSLRTPALTTLPVSPGVGCVRRRHVLAMSSTDAAQQAKAVGAGASGAELTWLEGNSWLWSVGGVKVLVDPIFDTLDFGMPAFYKADKRVFNDYEALTKRMAQEADHVVITQGLPDHCCAKTLPRLAAALPKTARVVAPPSAEPVLSQCFPDERITYARPGDSVTLETRDGGAATLTVYRGSLVGPPTQAPENAYLMRPGDRATAARTPGGIFYEPHCMWREGDLRGVRADAIVTPTYGQRLGPELLHYTVLNSGERAVELARALGATTLVSYNNVEMEATGALTLLVTRTGDRDEFERLARAAGVQYVQAVPGQPITP